MRIEKELIKLTRLHQEIEKEVLIGNINRILKEKGVYRKKKVQWVCDVTGSPSGTAYTWFTYAQCRSVNKIPLYALCQIAVALKISVYDFLETENVAETVGFQKIDRRSKLYWHLRRNEAEALWNKSHESDEPWQVQSLDVQRKFLDELYQKKVEERKNIANQ